MFKKHVVRPSYFYVQNGPNPWNLPHGIDEKTSMQKNHAPKMRRDCGIVCFPQESRDYHIEGEWNLIHFQIPREQSHAFLKKRQRAWDLADHGPSSRFGRRRGGKRREILILKSVRRSGYYALRCVSSFLASACQLMEKKERNDWRQNEGGKYKKENRYDENLVFREQRRWCQARHQVITQTRWKSNDRLST